MYQTVFGNSAGNFGQHAGLKWRRQFAPAWQKHANGGGTAPTHEAIRKSRHSCDKAGKKRGSRAPKLVCTVDIRHISRVKLCSTQHITCACRHAHGMGCELVGGGCQVGHGMIQPLTAPIVKPRERWFWIEITKSKIGKNAMNETSAIAL